jgi:hypothetical protein
MLVPVQCRPLQPDQQLSYVKSKRLLNNMQVKTHLFLSVFTGVVGMLFYFVHFRTP